MRRATLVDVPRMVEMAIAMHAESRYQRFRINPLKIEEFFAQAIGDPSFIALVDGDPVGGMLIGCVSEFWWGDDLESSDVLIYVSPERRGSLSVVRLINGYRTVAENLGVADIKIGVSSGVNTARTLKLFEKLGFHSFANNCALTEQSASVH